MSRIVIVICAALVAVVAGFAVIGMDDGNGTGEAISGSETSYPSSNDESMGNVAVLEETGTGVIVKAVPEYGFSFLGWFSDGVMLSDRMVEDFASDVMDSVEAVFSIGFIRNVEFEWSRPLFSSDGLPSGLAVPETMSVSMDSAGFYRTIADGSVMRHATYAEPMPTFLLSDDPAVDSVVNYLEPFMDGLTNLQKATVLAWFVQDSVSYISDREQYGETEFWTSVAETLFMGRGDCEDTATMYVNLGARLGLDVGFVAFESPVMGHMSAAVALDDGESLTARGTFVVDGTVFAYVETAIDGMHSDPGQLTSRYSILDGSWTHVVYDPTTGTYTGSPTVPIGAGSVTGASVIYGRY